MRMFVILLALALLLPATMLAQSGTPVLSILEQTTVTGFVDASYYGDLSSSVNSFALDQAEVDVIRTVDDYGIVLRADLEWVNTGTGYRANLEQGYLNYTLPSFEKLQFTFGKFNAPIGFELLDPVDMYQYSHSLLFVYALPTNLTGVMGTVLFTDELGLQAYISNGWDLNWDNNSQKTIGGRLGYTTDQLALGGSAILGVVDGPAMISRTVFDIDASYMINDTWLLGGEFNVGSLSYDVDGAEDDSWMGLMVMTHVDLNDWFGLTGRYDMIDDADGALFGTLPTTGEGYTRSSLTIAPTFVIGPGLGALAEFRMDMAGEDVFTDRDGEATGSNSFVAFEMTYSF